MSLNHRTTLRFRIWSIAAIATLAPIAGCSGSHSNNAPEIFHDELTGHTTIADALKNQRVIILKPLVVFAVLPNDPGQAEYSTAQERAQREDSMTSRFVVTFDSVLRATVRDESIARIGNTPAMPKDSVRAYDSLAVLSTSGVFDLAIVPDQIEILPPANGGAEHREHSRGGRGGGGMGGGRHGGGGMRPTPEGSPTGQRGIQFTLRCTYSIVRASDNRTIFSGQFTIPDATIGRSPATANSVKRLCENFLGWKNE